MRQLLFSLPFVVALAAFSDDVAGYVTPSGVTLLTEAEILQLLAGNTLASEKRDWGEHYTEDGKLRGLSNNEYYRGKWKVDGAVICFSYPASEFNRCRTLSRSGNIFSYYDLEGKPRGAAELVEGNPMDL